MQRLCYVDLVLYCERGVSAGELLLKKHAHSIGYLEHLPEAYAPVAIHGANFNQIVIRDKFRFEAAKGSNHFCSMPVGLFAKIRTMQPDVLMFNGFQYALQLLLLKRFLPPKTRVLLRNHAEQPCQGPRAWLQRWAARYVDGFVFVSNEQAGPWKRQKIILPHHKLFEVMEGSTDFKPADRQHCRQRLGLPAGPAFLWVGRLDANKDPLTILKAFHRFKQTSHPFSLSMVFNADALASEAARSIRENDLSSQVKLVGAVKHEEMECWYNAADYFVLGSHHEGSGYALCEALACACIPIVTDIPSFRAMTNNGKLGWLFEPGSVGQLAQALNRTVGLNQEPLRKQARQFFQEQLSHQAIAGKIHRACREMLGPDFRRAEGPLSLTPRL